MSNIYKMAQITLLTGVMAINYILYCTKDTLIVHHMGPESVVFLRTYVVIPFVLLFFFLSTRFSSLWGIRNFFSGVIGAFMSFQLLFAYYLYPEMDSLKWEGGLDLLQFWPLTVFYVLAEIWVVFVLGVITWQAINAVNTVDSAKKSYHNMQLYSNGVIFLTSQCILCINWANDWLFSLKFKALIMVVLGAVTALSVHKLLPPTATATKKKKSFTLLPFIKALIKSKQPFALFVMVLLYAFGNTFCETMNRYFIKLYSEDMLDYNNVMAVQSSCMSVFTILFILLGAYLTRRELHLFALLVTPVTIFLTCILYYFVPANPTLIVGLSVFQIAVIKGSKYGLIDPVKEFCYLSMDDEMKQYGKSFIDGVSNRAGKALGNLVQQVLIIGFGGIGLSLPLFLTILMVVAVIWIWNTFNIHSSKKVAIAS